MYMNIPTKEVEYDDENIEHVSSGPDYGTSCCDRWEESRSFELFYRDRYIFNGFSFRLILV